MQDDRQDEDWADHLDARERYLADRLEVLLNQEDAPTTEDAELFPALKAADKAQRLARVRLDPAFVRNLEVRMFSADAESATRRESASADDAHWANAPAASTGDAPAWARPGTARQVRVAPSVIQRQQRWTFARRHPLYFSLAVAAVVLFALTSSVLALAVEASPGSPLYGLHRALQHAQAQLAPDPGDRARLALGIAQSSLENLEGAIGTGDGSDVLADLTIFQNDYGTATAAVNSLPAGPQRSSLAATLASLRAREQGDLYRALPTMSWANRVTATKAIAGLGNTVPQINLVTYTGRTGGTSGTGSKGPSGKGATPPGGLLVIIHGSGFAAGAVVYVGGKPLGEVRRVTRDEIQVLFRDATALKAGAVIGVVNPDGTAAQILLENRVNPSAQPTPTNAMGDVHGSHRGSAGSGSQG